MFKKIATSAIVMMAAAAASADDLTVYSAGPKPLSAALAEAFTAKTGITVNLFQSTSGKVMARYEAEKANPQADVLISASWGHAITLSDAGELLPYTSPNADTVPASLKTEDYVAQGAAAIAMVYNTSLGLPAPAEWSDLTDEAYKDMVTMPDPSASGAALSLVQGLASQDADAAWSLMGALKDNGMIVPGANAAALNPVLSGARGVVFGAVDYIALGQKAKGEAIEVVYPESGTVLAPRPIMIPATTDQADEAKQFMDFVLSDEGQALVADRMILPARTDISSKRAGWDELSLIDFDYVKAAAESEDTISAFKAAVE
ncbi:ABC transporter substrate-binding protein [Celeribacter halophilus]|uniref:ABC transporter substrate-binding protein n=1 Tax=Celeribacter halophilus TaxID=576117 RepID=UPI003A8E5671